MEALAIGGYAVFGLLAFGLRSVVQLRQTGSTGFRGLSGRPGSLEWLGGVLFIVAIVLGVAAPVLALGGWLPAVASLDRAPVHGLGVVLYVAGLAGTLWAQFAMGESWRIGVDASERTPLVTRAPFDRVRNPIFTSMIAAVAGLGLLTPNLAGLLAPVVLTLAVEIHVRRVEEPYLERSHGATYAQYRARTGRFLPGVGR